MFGVDTSNPMFEEQKHRKRPQDEVPEERIIHYIVKDYRRMYNMHNALVEKLYEQEAKIKHLELCIQRKGLLGGDTKTQINNLTIKVASLEGKLKEEQAKRRSAVNRYNKIRARLQKFQNLLNQLPKELEEEEE